MSRISRYVLFELVAVFLMTLTGITLLLLFAGLAKEGLLEGLGISSIARIVPYVLSIALQPSLPATILIAACSVYGRMSADNEILAIKSLGISPLAIIYPALALGFMVSIFGVWINDIAPSWGRTGITHVLIESAEEIVYRMLRTQKRFSGKGFSINVKGVDGKRLIEPHITIAATDRSPTISIRAREAELESKLADETFHIVLRNGIVDIGNGRYFDFQKSTYRQAIPLPSVIRKGNLDSPSVVPLRRIDAEAAEHQKEMAAAERLAASEAAYQLMTGDFAALTNMAEWGPRVGHIESNRSRIQRLQLEPHRRWASGFSCFFFVLVGAPLAIMMRTRNFFTTFAACFLPILLVYYPLLAFSVDRAKDGALPAYTVWMGNAVMACVGVWILQRVIRY
jgi:lipopolysaccharide export system permease protein